MFNRTLIYIKIYTNRVVIKNLNTRKETIIDECIFSNDRYLIAEFTKLTKALELRIKEVYRESFAFFAPKVVVHPMELVDKELCEVERQILSELIENSFRTQPLLWLGKTLSDVEVREYAFSN